MSVFKPIYNAVLDAFDFIAEVADINFYAFIACLAFLVLVAISVVLQIFSIESRTARRLVKIDNMLDRQTKKPKDDFVGHFHSVMLKGKNKVAESYKAYLSYNRARIENVFNDSKIVNVNVKEVSTIKTVNFTIAFLLFFVSIKIAIRLEPTLDVLSQIFLAGIFPVVLVVLNVAFLILMKKFSEANNAKLVKYAKQNADRILKFITNNNEKMAAFKEIYQKQFGITGTAATESGGEITEESFNNLAADVDEVKRLSREFLEENAKLMSQRDELEKAYLAEKEEMKQKDVKLESELVQYKTELENLRQQMIENDNKEVAENLMKQEGNQLKLIMALEKLKTSQQKHYIESEAKLQAELVKIDEVIEAKRKRAEEKMRADLNVFAEKLIKEKQAEVNARTAGLKQAVVAEEKTSPETMVTEEQRKDINMQKTEDAKLPQNEELVPNTKEITAETKQEFQQRSQTEKGKKKNINEALTDLLSAMNKYNGENSTSTIDEQKPAESPSDAEPPKE